MSLMAVAAYNPAPNVQTTAYVERRTQSFLGQDYGVNSFGGTVIYQHKLLDGYFNSALNVTENTSDNSGGSGNGFGLGFANSSQLRSVSFTLAVNKEQTVGCAATNPDNLATATAGFFGDYFNPGLAQDGQTGDIVASIGVTNFSTNTSTTFDVGASISQCQDPKCDGQTTLSFQDLGPVAPGSTNTLAAAWDQANHRFIFSLNDNPPVTLTYNMPDNFPPGIADKSFFVFGFVPHCTSAPRPFASLDTTFGDVYVNR